MTRTMDKKPKRNSTIEISLLPDGHAVLVCKKTDWAYTLTPLGALVWEFCDGESTRTEIVEQIKSLPELPTHSALDAEVMSFLDELVDSGLVLEE